MEGSSGEEGKLLEAALKAETRTPASTGNRMPLVLVSGQRHTNSRRPTAKQRLIVPVESRRWSSPGKLTKAILQFQKHMGSPWKS